MDADGAIRTYKESLIPNEPDWKQLYYSLSLRVFDLQQAAEADVRNRIGEMVKKIKDQEQAIETANLITAIEKTE